MVAEILGPGEVWRRRDQPHDHYAQLRWRRTSEANGETTGSPVARMLDGKTEPQKMVCDGGQ